MATVDLSEPLTHGLSVTRSKTVSWHDPAALATAGAMLPGREFLQWILDRRLPPPPMAALIGAEPVSVGEGEFAEAHAHDHRGRLVGHATTTLAITRP